MPCASSPRSALPIDGRLACVLGSLAKTNNLVLSAEPGAGKTTRLPPELLKITNKEVWVLEPRRIAAIAACHRIAQENGWQVGREIGYHVRFDRRSSQQTRLFFITEALLLRKLLQDPELKNVGCVVLDEFHERSLHVDIALGALKELQQLARPDLKIIVMSATLNAAPLASFLEAPIVQIPGKVFPLEVVYDTNTQLLRTGFEFIERLRKLVQKALIENSEGDLLCFLPGRSEIERLHEALKPLVSKVNIFPLHGQLSLQEQKEALTPTAGRRRVILATNVAESSLTVEGVRIVVDSGLARISEIHPRTGFASMELARISKASAKQRAGRAARGGAGKVYRAWMPYDELSMKDFETAELHRSDLAESVLLLSALGVTQPQSFSWFEAPLERLLRQAKDFLHSLGALAQDGSLTELGKSLQDFPIAPRLAKLLFIGRERGLGTLACQLAAILSEAMRSQRDFSDGENDLWPRLLDWQRNPYRYPALSRSTNQLVGLLGDFIDRPVSDLESASVELLLAVYPDRVCRRRRSSDPQAKMVGGRGVRLHEGSSVKTSEFFLAIEIKEGRDANEALVFSAVGLPQSLVQRDLIPLAKTVSRIDWEEERERFWVVETDEHLGLSLGSERRRPANPLEVEGNLAEIVYNGWSFFAGRNEELAAWLARLDFLQQKGKIAPLAQEQLRAAIELACFGETELKKVFSKDMVPYFESQFSEFERDLLARECPATWVAPSGSRLKIHYSKEQGAQVEVRMQELFGLKSAPQIAGQAMTMILLAPNFRPVQVTRDLASFWQNGYYEVRKELRLRYPKHSWPEDPLTASPQAKGRPRQI